MVLTTKEAFFLVFGNLSSFSLWCFLLYFQPQMWVCIAFKSL